MDTMTTKKTAVYGHHWQILDGTALKLIAVTAMILDHVGDNFFPDQIWMRIIGRMALPIFAFCIAEGFSHTKDRRRYLCRMGLFALLSEIPFDLVTSGKVLEFSHQNIMMTFFWAILGLMIYEQVRNRRYGQILGAAVLLLFTVSSLFLRLDYQILAVGLIILYYLLRNEAPLINNLAAMAYHVLLRNVGIYWFGVLGFVPVLLYNGKRGRGLKWFFYLFYPLHLLAIYILKELL